MERKDETRVKGFDLPPGAGRGSDDKGHVTLTVDGLEWQLRGAPPWVRVTARWWGDELSDKRQRPWAKLVDGPGGSASMTFPVKAKPAGFSRYCRDARAVVLEVRPRCAPRPETRRGSMFDSKKRTHAKVASAIHPSIHPPPTPPSPDRVPIPSQSPPTPLVRSFPTGAPPGTSPAPASTSRASTSTVPSLDTRRRSRPRRGARWAWCTRRARWITSPARCRRSSSTSTSAGWTIPSPWRRRRRYAR